MSTTYHYVVSYCFNEQVREHSLELEHGTLPVEAAALHLLQLHFGDAENGLIMPKTDAAPSEVLDQARLLGITRVSPRLIS